MPITHDSYIHRVIKISVIQRHVTVDKITTRWAEIQLHPEDGSSPDRLSVFASPSGKWPSLHVQLEEECVQEEAGDDKTHFAFTKEELDYLINTLRYDMDADSGPICESILKNLEATRGT